MRQPLTLTKEEKHEYLLLFYRHGKTMTPNAVTLSANDKAQQLLLERYAPAKAYKNITVTPDAWEYPPFGLIDTEGRNVDWNSLWNAAAAISLTDAGYLLPLQKPLSKRQRCIV